MEDAVGDDGGVSAVAANNEAAPGKMETAELSAAATAVV